MVFWTSKLTTLALVLSTSSVVIPEITRTDDPEPASAPPTSQQTAIDADLVRADIEAHADKSGDTLLYKVTADQLVDLIDDPKTLSAAIAAAGTVSYHQKKIKPDPDHRFHFQEDTVRIVTILEYGSAAAKKFGLINN